MAFLPLQGVVVLDLTRYLPGPMLTRLLVDLGATVYKIEPPGGDTVRWMPPHLSDTSAGFGALHAGKRSVVLDLKQPHAADVLRAMVRSADVLVEGNRPGVMDRLGVGPADLHAANPRLIIASLSGFGQHTSRRDTAGHDLGYLAWAGVLAGQGPSDGVPAVPAVQTADLGGGSWPAAVGILGALLERQQTGRGRHLDLSLARGSLPFIAVPLAAAAAGAVEPRGDGLLTGAAPCYRCYPTSDGGFVAIGALEPHFWSRLCAALGRPDLASDAFAAGARRDVVIAELTAAFAAHDRDHWRAVFAQIDAACEVVRTPDEVLVDPDLAPQLTRVGDHLVVRPDVGATAELPPLSPPPDLGADTLAACEALGVDPALVAAARSTGALG